MANTVGKALRSITLIQAQADLTKKYHLGQQIFVNIHEHRGQKDVVISHYKRDVYLIMLSWLVVILLYLTMQFQGIRSLLSVILNFVLFFIDSPNRCLFESDKFLLAFCNSGFALYCIILALVIG